MDEKTLRQAEFFKNRIEKRFRHLSKWARREKIGAFLLYDKDIPEIPLRVDYFEDVCGEKFAVMTLYARPYEKSDEDEWLGTMNAVLQESLGVAAKNLWTKVRKKQRGAAQYEKISTQRREAVVQEGTLKFIVNFSDYLDCGLFFDLRALRRRVFEEAAGKSILNLFCYTGAFSVFAAAGGCSRVVSVDLSKNYLDWAKRNFAANSISADAAEFVAEDCVEFLRHDKRGYDMIILDPPTFSNSSRSPSVIDINRDWTRLLQSCRQKLNAGGTIYFSTNSQKFKFDEDFAASIRLSSHEISRSVVSPDFEGRRLHRAWRLVAF